MNCLQERRVYYERPDRGLADPIPKPDPNLADYILYPVLFYWIILYLRRLLPEMDKIYEHAFRRQRKENSTRGALAPFPMEMTPPKQRKGKAYSPLLRYRVTQEHIFAGGN